MQCVGSERDLAQRVTPGVVDPFEITLEYQTSLAHDDNAMEIPNALLSGCLVEQWFQIGGKSRFAWSDRRPVGPCSQVARIDGAIARPVRPVGASPLFITQCSTAGTGRT